MEALRTPAERFARLPDCPCEPRLSVGGLRTHDVAVCHHAPGELARIVTSGVGSV